ncbi:ADP-ribosylglycohydrolase family protein [Candidatus Xianfuyuplasma coldseepsis]|uniref:ADP-ribosylglycohydrolase n=1 Tax=Candidatus Xianfuyuplasma coldseepsis TaxID=2782163 RepID=A0A7L7KPJ6_9MOLU|nr:ADP-ribosylglycohydrolase family protein [Xianfuyuplasma coldseepsis]QMS84710.1 hypothetical protein G4Z02_02725 [Xianfuyuplasma coldseepsis]
MNKISIIKSALLGSASALAYHWIYDPQSLMARKNSGYPMIFENIDHDFYKEAKNTYDVYPHHLAGDLDFMGEMLYLTHKFLEKNTDLEEYRKLLYNSFKEDSPYNGWVEAYVKDFLKVYKDEIDGKRQPQLDTAYVDKQLVGLIYILAVFEKEYITDKVTTAVNFAKTVTSYENIEPLTTFLFNLLKELEQGITIQQALQNCSSIIPELYRDAILKSSEDIDIITFAKEHAGIACGLDQALPLIFYILQHTSSWEEAMVLNATIGGASANRGIFISAIASRYLEIPKEYQSKLNYNVK